MDSFFFGFLTGLSLKITSSNYWKEGKRKHFATWLMVDLKQKSLDEGAMGGTTRLFSFHCAASGRLPDIGGREDIRLYWYSVKTGAF